MSISEEGAPARSRLYFANLVGALCPPIPGGAVAVRDGPSWHTRADKGDEFAQVPLGVGLGSVSGRLGQGRRAGIGRSFS